MYIALKPAIFDNEKLKMLLTDNLELDGVVENLHLTLMYDDSDFDNTKYYNIPSREYKASFKRVCKLGDKIVMLVDSDPVQERFKELTNLGYKHSFYKLVPHISLCDITDENVMKIPKIERLLRKKCDVVTLTSEYKEKLHADENIDV